MYKTVVERLAVDCPELFKWCLDFPCSHGKVTLAELEKEGVLFQGWLLTDPWIPSASFIRSQDQTHYFPLDRPRPDVVRKIFAQESNEHPQLRCGFQFRLPLLVRDAEFGFRIGARDILFARLRVEGELKVLEGKQGWLFLDNDTNQSVEQYTGKLLLDRSARKNWRNYLRQLSRVAFEIGCQHAVLIAPSKEMVLPGFYPFTKGKKTPVEQVVKLASAKHRVVYPQAELQASEERSFMVTDTHWTSYGARLAVTETLVELGIVREQVAQVFAGDRYAERVVGGDLGSKFYPRRQSAEKHLASFSYSKYVIYDNHLPNFGRIVLLSNPEALISGRCLIFGSSSSYATLNYFSRIFSDLLMVHTAGNIDLDLIRHEAPSYLIAQTNGRFVIRPPMVGYNLRSAVAQKLELLPDGQRAEVLHKAEQWLGKGDLERVGHYHAMLAVEKP